MVHVAGHSRGRAQPDQGSSGNYHLGIETLDEDSIPAALMQAHYDELAPMKGTLKMAPDWRAYRQMQAAGELLFITIRLDWTMVGYMVLVIKPHLHYRETKVAVDDLHYLTPECRGKGWGKKMIVFAEAAAHAAGASIFSMRCKKDANHGYIFESMGYELTDLVYLKDLTHA